MEDFLKTSALLASQGYNSGDQPSKAIFPQMASNHKNSFFAQMKPFCILAYLTGILPIRGLLRSTKIKELSVKKFSVLYILCCLVVGIKFFGLCKILSVKREVPAMTNSTNWKKATQDFKFSITDMLSQSIGIAIAFVFGLIAHIISLMKLNDFLFVSKLMELYDQSYDSESLKPPKIFTGSSLLATICTLTNTFCFVLIEYFRLNSTETYADELPIYIFYPYVKIYSTWAITILILLIMLLIDYATIFVYLQLLYLSQMLCFRVDHITTEMTGMIEAEIEKYSNHTNIPANSSLGKKLLITEKAWTDSEWLRNGKTSWNKLGRRFLELGTVFEAFEKFAWLYLLVIFTFTIVCTICLMYAVVTGNAFDGFPSQKLGEIWAVVTILISMLRLIIMTNMGESFQKSYANLKKVALRCNQDYPTLGKEKDEISQLAHLITAMPIQLSAGGFFVVYRQNVTSIISVIITYIIVLIQFRVTETSSPSSVSSSPPDEQIS